MTTATTSRSSIPDQIRNSSHQQQKMLNAHLKLQRFVLRYVCAPTSLYFLVNYLTTPNWQNMVMLISAIGLFLGWFYAFRITLKDNRAERSVYWFVETGIAFEFVALMVLEGNDAPAMIACLNTIIYASLFSVRHLLVATITTIAAYFVAMAFGDLGLFNQIVLVGTDKMILNGFFVAMLVPVAAYMLRWSLRLQQDLFDDVASISTRQHQIINTAKEVEQSIEEVSSQLSEFTSNFSAQAAQQASALSETGSAMNRINQIANANATSASVIKTASDETRLKSTSTIAQLQQVRTGFNRIIGTNENARSDFAELSVLAESIDAVLRLNRDIAAQIKILAVNAGIQAAKAGSYGAGFKVVAKELKSMIGRTEKSLEDSSLLLENIQEKAKMSAGSIEASSRMLQQHYEALDATGKLVEDISENFAQTAVQFDEVTAGSNAQLAGINEVKAGIDQINTAAHELSQRAEALKAATDEMTSSQRKLHLVLRTADQKLHP